MIISFDNKYVWEILDGSKRSTWRLGAACAEGTICRLFNSASGREFSKAKVSEVKRSRLKYLPLESSDGTHEDYKSRKDLYSNFRRYYGPRVGPETMVNIIKFEVLKERVLR